MRGKLFECAVAGLILGCGASGTFGAYTAKGKISVPSGFKTTWKVDFTKDGEVIASDTFSYTNDTSEGVTKDWEAEGPDDANDFETRSKTRKTANNVGATASSVIPTQVPVMKDYLDAMGFSLPNTFDLPLVVGDVNHNGLLDETDAPVFSRIDDLFAFTPFANASNFSMHSVLMADPAGHVGSLAGITFYADEAMTQPFSSEAMLVTGIVSQSVPEPGAAMCGVAMTLGLLRRRRGTCEM